MTVVTLLLVTGCQANSTGDQLASRTAALAGGNSQLDVPAYLTNGSDWSRLLQLIHPNDVVIVNGSNSGPDSSTNPVLQGHITALNNAGAVVLGYISNAAGTSTVTIDGSDGSEGEIQKWHHYYSGINGIYFDSSHRDSDNELPQFERIAVTAANTFSDPSGGPGWVMFNLEYPTNEANYVDCVMRYIGINSAKFVTQENYYSTYISQGNMDNWNSPSWNWVNNYNPWHFTHLIHDLPINGTTAQIQASSQTVLTNARSWNATGVYVTDGLQTGNTWGTLANQTAWSYEAANTNVWSDWGYPGTVDETFLSYCPMPQETASTAVIYSSDASFHETTSTPAAGWNTTASFDDSSWFWASVNEGGYGVGPWGTTPAMPAGTPAQWIWGYNASQTATVYFRRTFTPWISSATITVTADNSYQMWVNGTLVSTGNNWTQPQAVRVTLTPGTPNLIALAVTNAGGAGGLLLDMR